APAAAHAPAPAPAPAAPAAAKPIAAAPTPKPAAAPPAGRLCHARVTSRPSGATVLIGARRLGSTPLDTGELPCETTLTLVRPRYNNASAPLAESTGSPSALFVKMNR